MIVDEKDKIIDQLVAKDMHEIIVNDLMQKKNISRAEAEEIIKERKRKIYNDLKYN